MKSMCCVLLSDPCMMLFYSDCDTSIEEDICNGGVCRDDSTGCNCTNTNRIGIFCQYESNTVHIILF